MSLLSDREVLVLRAIADFCIREGHPPSQEQLWSTEGSILNDFIDKHNVDTFLIGLPHGFRSRATVNNAVASLREANMLINDEARNPYEPTAEGYTYLEVHA